MTSVCEAASTLTRVYKVKNAPTANPDDFAYMSNTITKLWEMLGGPERFIDPTDVVVIKANGQWKNHGSTHTGCIKAVIDRILAIPNFSGEVIICDNLQGYGTAGATGFDSTPANRVNNWSQFNWTQLVADYRLPANNKPVGLYPLKIDTNWRTPPTPLPSSSPWNPAAGLPSGPTTLWSRYFFSFQGHNCYLSCPVFESPVTSGRIIDLQKGVWENGGYSGRKVKTIVMPTLNNHSYFGGNEDYAGISSAVKSFFGASEIYHGSGTTSDSYIWNGYYSLHAASLFDFNNSQSALYAGQLVGTYLNTFFSPVLYITPALYSGWFNRFNSDGAAFTNTVLACTNPVSLDYVACRDVISKAGSPKPTWLDPSTQNNNTWRQLLGCSSQGIGTVDPQQMDIITYDFARPTATRLDIERKIRDFKAGKATEQDVKDIIQLYMSAS